MFTLAEVLTGTTMATRAPGGFARYLDTRHAECVSVVDGLLAIATSALALGDVAGARDALASSALFGDERDAIEALWK